MLLNKLTTLAVLLLTLALAVSTFSQAFLASWHQSQIDQANFAVGAPVRVYTEQLGHVATEDDFPAGYTGGVNQDAQHLRPVNEPTLAPENRRTDAKKQEQSRQPRPSQEGAEAGQRELRPPQERVDGSEEHR